MSLPASKTKSPDPVIKILPDPVISLITLREFSEASDPLTISFFQFGIVLQLRLVTQKSPLPFRANNSFIYK